MQPPERVTRQAWATSGGLMARAEWTNAAVDIRALGDVDKFLAAPGVRGRIDGRRVLTG